jgi:hypothetical protein
MALQSLVWENPEIAMDGDNEPAEDLFRAAPCLTGVRENYPMSV